MLNDDLLLTIDGSFDPEPHIHIKNSEFIKKLLVDLDILCCEPYDLVNRWKMVLMRNNASLKELLNILSLGRFENSGEREKLKTEMGFKYTLIKLDNLIEDCPLIR